MKLNICHLYPDLLNLYGDRGNIKCLAQRLLWRGIGAEVARRFAESVGGRPLNLLLESVGYAFHTGQRCQVTVRRRLSMVPGSRSA